MSPAPAQSLPPGLLRDLLKKVRRIEITTNRVVNEVMAGSYHSVFKGRGMEFDKVREYQYGDDVRTIDWNVTARTGVPHIKNFVEERELTVMLLVDLSGSANFGTASQFKSEIAAEMSALLAFSATRNNDRVGLLLFSDQVESFIPPKKGRNHALRVVREILAWEPVGRRTSIMTAVEHLMRVLTRKSVVFLISDFEDSGLRKPLNLLNRNHDLIALRLRDPRELAMPAVGLVDFEDPETGEILTVDTNDRAFRERFARIARDHQAETEQLFRQLRIDYADIDTNQPYLDRIVEIFLKRSRRY